MTDNKDKNNLSMIFINGLILGVIGILILITPLVTEIPKEKIKLDIIAGAVLLAVGIICLIYEITTIKKK